MRSSTGNSTSGSGGEIGVSSKTFQEGQVVVVELGLNLQNQDRPFLCNQGGKSASPGDHDDDQDDDNGGNGSGKGPTCNGYSSVMKSDVIYDNATSVGVHSSSPANSTPGFVRGLQPFDASYPSAHPFFKTSVGGGMATASAMGFPFTAAQWKELERQAMIYKYMVASVPVPADLLYSSFPTNLSPPTTFSPTSYFLGKYGNGLNLRWVGNSKDAEPGRCRRTDGKKWRCSRDVAPNQKYCERHMHRGRPRSRKPVEQLLHNPLSDFPTNSKIKNTNATKKTRLNDPNSTQPVVSSFPSVQMSKASGFDHPVVSAANPFEDSRNLAWAEEQQWQQLVQSSMNPSVFQHQFGGEPLNLISHGGYNPKSDMGLLEKPLIDAWSMGLPGNKDNYGSNKTPFSNGGHGHGSPIDEHMCQIHMGLGVIDSWVGSSPTSPGGPLAEVLRPGSVAANATAAHGLASNPATSDAGEGDFVTPPATAVSSPSGVLQKTHASFSDSSGSSSPTYHNSKAKSDMPFHWLN